jgi:hypothetical protein
MFYNHSILIQFIYNYSPFLNHFILIKHLFDPWHCFEDRCYI